MALKISDEARVQMPMKTVASLIALSGWSLTTTVGLKSDVAVLKEKVSGVENEIQDFKNLKGKKKRKKKNTNN